MNITLKAIETVNNMKRITFSLETTASQHIRLQQQLVLHYPQIIDTVYFTPFDASESGCCLVLVVPENDDLMETLSKHDLVRKLVVEHYPHQNFEQFIEKTKKELEKCQQEKPIKKHLVDAYLDYAPLEQLHVMQKVAGVMTPIEPKITRVGADPKSNRILLEKDILEPKTLYGVFFNYTEDLSDPNFNIELSEENYKNVALLEYETNRAKKRGQQFLEFQLDKKPPILFAFEEKASLYGDPSKDPIRFMLYMTSFNPSTKRILKVPHTKIDSRRKYWIVYSPEIHLARYEIWEMDGPSPEQRRKCVYQSPLNVDSKIYLELLKKAVKQNRKTLQPANTREEKKDEATQDQTYVNALQLLEEDHYKSMFASLLTFNENHERFVRTEPQVTFLEKAMAHLPSYILNRKIIKFSLPDDPAAIIAYAIFSTHIMIKADLLRALSSLKAGTFHQANDLIARQQLQNPRRVRQFQQNVFNLGWTCNQTQFNPNESRFESLLQALSLQITLPTEDAVVQEIIENLENYSNGNFLDFSLHCFSSMKSLELLYLTAIVRLTDVSLCIYHDNQGTTMIHADNPLKTVTIGYMVGYRYVSLSPVTENQMDNEVALWLDSYNRKFDLLGSKEVKETPKAQPPIAIVNKTATAADLPSQTPLLVNGMPIYSGNMDALRTYLQTHFANKEIAKNFLLALGIRPVIQTDDPLNTLKTLFKDKIKVTEGPPTFGMCEYNIVIDGKIFQYFIKNTPVEKQKKAREVFKSFSENPLYFQVFLPKLPIDETQNQFLSLRNFFAMNSIFQNDLMLRSEDRVFLDLNKSSQVYLYPFYLIEQEKQYLEIAIDKSNGDDQRLSIQAFWLKIEFALLALDVTTVKQLSSELAVLTAKKTAVMISPQPTAKEEEKIFPVPGKTQPSQAQQGLFAQKQQLPPAFYPAGYTTAKSQPVVTDLTEIKIAEDARNLLAILGIKSWGGQYNRPEPCYDSMTDLVNYLSSESSTHGKNVDSSVLMDHDSQLVFCNIKIGTRWLIAKSGLAASQVEAEQEAAERLINNINISIDVVAPRNSYTQYPY